MRFGINVVVLAVLFVGGQASVGQPAINVVGQPPTVPNVVLTDFVPAFDPSFVQNSSSASASRQETSGGVSMPGIFVHPQGTDDAKVSYPLLRVPPAIAEAPIPTTSFLVFHIGMRDGIPWDAQDNPANGVRFSIAVEGEEVFREDVRGPGWRARALDLTRWAGNAIRVELRTNAIDGNTSYDWAVFGEPLVLAVPTKGTLESINAEANGVALAQVECEEPSEVAVTVGPASTATSLPAGTNWVPVFFDRPGPASIDVRSGKAKLTALMAAAHHAEMKALELTLSSPLVRVGEPFAVLLKLRNQGHGKYLGGTPWKLQGFRPTPPGPTVGEEANKEIEPGLMAPGEEKILKWPGLVAAEPANWTLPNGQPFHIFPEQPALEPTRSAGVGVEVKPEGSPVRAVLQTPGWRLTFIGDDSREVYAVADVWNGREWQRAGSIYPLANGLMPGPGQPQFLTFKAAAFREDGNGLTVEGSLESPQGTAYPARVTFQADGDTGRIRMEAVLEPPAATKLMAFLGPSVLAGDRAYGVNKDFAIFPGLEYLEGDEASSSTRDLASPLNDRRVPAIHKIATPLMAVQGQGSLMALMWDPNQEWAKGETRPAARFMAPDADSGFTCTRMGLFAPSVGTYVKENTFFANIKQYEVPEGGVVKLSGLLVLDHASRYPEDSVVNGPHKGGLVLQAMRHYFDVFGMPKPSGLPRSWDDERALCRDAYYHAVWSDDPPGWAHCQGWKTGLMVSHSVPLMLDLEAGVPDDVRAETQRRISAVTDRALKDEGPHYLWSNAGCHIVLGEMPFLFGYTAESLADMRNHAQGLLKQRENGLWVWHPSGEKYATLGKDGDHTLSQAAQPLYFILRTARLTGDRELMRQGLDAIKQMEQYEVPRGAQTWECPLYQPDILASAQAIRAYTEAYRLTGDPAHLDHARYWAWTGLPFLYTWEMDGYPTMRYNVISVIGSTFYTHSWIGLPVVWCGLVYAYALQDLAEFDDSFAWKTVAEGITNSAIQQQYADGPSKGCYPDSWNMEKNKPNPADINPENILMNGFRLRGLSAEPRFVRLDGADGPVSLNAACDISNLQGAPKDKSLSFTLQARKGLPSFAVLAPVPEPASIEGIGARANDSAALQSADTGWLYAPDLEAVIVKCKDPATVSMKW